MTWAEVGCSNDWATQVPQGQLVFKKTFIWSTLFFPPFPYHYPQWSFQNEVTRENKMKTDMVCKLVTVPWRRSKQSKEWSIGICGRGVGRWQGRALTKSDIWIKIWRGRENSNYRTQRQEQASYIWQTAWSLVWSRPSRKPGWKFWGVGSLRDHCGDLGIFYSGGNREPLKGSERKVMYFHFRWNRSKTLVKLNKSRTRKAKCLLKVTVQSWLKTQPSALLYQTLAPQSRLLSYMLFSFSKPPNKCFPLFYGSFSWK